MASSLNQAAVPVLNSSSPQAIAGVFGGLTAEFTACRWIGCRNRYTRDTVRKIRTDVLNRSLRHKDLARYIAASTVLHCVDGWAFLGRALHAHTVGDSHTARHLAYYAELRAATCILASQGIGVFNFQHFIVDSAGRCRQIPGRYGTHEIAWLGIEHWASGSSSADLLADIVRPDGIPLREWLDAFSVLPSWGPVGQDWLRTWGLDLKRFTEDRNARNQAAYRPTGVGTLVALPTVRICSFVRSLWSAYEPSFRSGFDTVDSHLLRLSLERAFRATQGSSPRRAPTLYRTRIERMIGVLSMDSDVGERWTRFLMRTTESPDTNLLVLALRKPDTKSPEYHLQVISRGSLLLRVATGICARLLAANQLSFDDLKFWWSSLAVERGFWEPESEPTSVVDLWRDVEDAITTICDWEDDNGPSNPPLAQLRASCASELSLLCNCELIGLWGLERF